MNNLLNDLVNYIELYYKKFKDHPMESDDLSDVEETQLKILVKAIDSIEDKNSVCKYLNSNLSWNEIKYFHQKLTLFEIPRNISFILHDSKIQGKQYKLNPHYKIGDEERSICNTLQSILSTSDDSQYKSRLAILINYANKVNYSYFDYEGESLLLPIVVPKSILTHDLYIKQH